MAKEKKTTQAEVNAAQERDRRFYFPEQNLTITADSREEAEKELARITKEEEADASDNNEGEDK